MSTLSLHVSADDQKAFMRMLKKAKIDHCSVFLQVSPSGHVGFYNESTASFGDDMERLNRFEVEVKDRLQNLVENYMENNSLPISEDGFKVYLTLKKKNKLTEVDFISE